MQQVINWQDNKIRKTVANWLTERTQVKNRRQKYGQRLRYPIGLARNPCNRRDVEEAILVCFRSKSTRELLCGNLHLYELLL